MKFPAADSEPAPLSAHRNSAAFLAAALLLAACGDKLREADKIDSAQAPVQTVDDMFAVQTENGIVKQRMESPRMERYDLDTAGVEFFPVGVTVYGYNEEGLLETMITAKQGRHVTPKHSGSSNETWSAFGNVQVCNLIKQETMLTDTIYWDRDKAEIYTDCYVQLISPDGMMQGYGMRSDDRARNAVLYNTFDSYGYTAGDTTKTQFDAINFIGPLLN